MKKRSTLFLSSLALLSLVSCGQSESGKALHPTSDPGTHLQSSTLHEVSVEESSLSFASNGKTDYVLLYEAGNASAQKAASTIAKHVLSATGAILPYQALTGEEQYSSSNHWILLNGDSLRKQAGITDTTKSIGVSGYQIDTKDSSCFIHVNGDYGYQQAAIAFLHHVLGYNRYSSKIVTYTKTNDGNVNLPKMSIVEKPDFSFHTQSNKVDSTTSYETGFLTSNEAFYTDSEIQAWHNSFDWLPKSTYQSAHPKWYSSAGEQICYTAHGDEEEYLQMVQTVSSRMVEKLATNKTVGAICFSIQDNHDICNCDACSADFSKYGAYSGSVVKFMNDVDDIVQAKLQEEADATGEEKREIDLCFFAYHRTESPCVRKDANGDYVPTSEDVVCNEHVGPLIAPIGACYTKSFYDETNETYANAIKGWGALSKRLYVWAYETNYSHYLYPLNTFSSMIESYRFFIENNALYLYNEGQHNQAAVTAFGRFKEYFNTVAEFNVNLSYLDIVDDFFTNYFGAAKESMLSYFQELQDHFTYIENTYPTEINGTIYNNIAQSRFWPKRLLDRWVSYIDQGIEAIEPLSVTDPTLYQSIYDNLVLESIFPRYALLENYSGTYSNVSLQQARSSFRSDCQRLGVSKYNENGNLDSIYASWGF